MKLNVPLLAVGAVIAAAAFVASRGARETGALLVSGAVDMVDGVIGEAGLIAGDVVGVPRTDCQRCNDAITEFNAAPWYEQAALSFSVATHCPLGDYLKWVATGVRPVCK